jgi:hypothetical protein
MLAWIVLLGLIVVEVVAIRWWLSANYYQLFFNEWAAVLYSALLAFDIAVAWLISMSYELEGTGGLQLLLVVGSCLWILVVLGTLFLRWVVRLEITDITDKDKKR